MTSDRKFQRPDRARTTGLDATICTTSASNDLKDGGTLFVFLLTIASPRVELVWSMCTARTVHLKELLVQKLTEGAWKLGSFRDKKVSTHQRPALQGYLAHKKTPTPLGPP